MRRSPVDLRIADYTLDDDQEAVRDAFASFFAGRSTPETVRAAEPVGFDAQLWKQLLELRLVAMGVPTEAGGDGATLVDLVLMTEEWGKSLAPAPIAESMTAARLLARAATDEAAAHLEDAMSGAKLITLALRPIERDVRQLVPAAAVADGVVGIEGDQLVTYAFVDRPKHVPNQGYAPLAWVDFTETAGERAVVASGAIVREVFRSAVSDWKLLMAGALVGMAQRALDIALDHAKSRHAFGLPIGSFQAIAHPLVDVAMDVEVARRITHKAAWWADRDGEDEAHLVPMAYLSAEEAAGRAATVGVHTLGGVGFTVESDEQLYFRRVKGWTLPAGDPQAELDSIADLLWGPARTGGAA